MSTLTLSYAFASGAQGWVWTEQGFPGSNGTAAWSGSVGDPAGALQLVQSTTATTQEVGYWGLSGTWESFGVPAGATVTGVSLSIDEWSGGIPPGESNQPGPHTLVDGPGATQATLLPQISVGVQSWTTRSGSTQSVPSGLQASSSTVGFRLGATIGQTGYYGGEVDFDNVALTITYSGGGGTTATLGAPAIPSRESWGAPSLTVGVSLGAPAIPRGEKWGAAAVGRSYQVNSPAIPSGESWGTPAGRAAVTLAAPAIRTGEKWGAAATTAVRVLSAPAIPSGESWGAAPIRVPASIGAPAIRSAESWGASALVASRLLSAPPIPPGESWGAAAVHAAATSSAPAIPTGEGWGAAATLPTHLLAAPAIPSGESWGAPTTETSVGILYSDLFGTKLGPLIATANQVNAFRGSTIPGRVATHVADYAGADASLAADLWSALASYQSGGAALLSALQALFRATVVQDVGAAIALPDQSLATAMAALVADMKTNNQTVAASSVGGSATAAAGNVGDAVVRIGTTSRSGLAQEDLLAESIAATVIADAQSGGATAGREVVRYQGQPAASGGNLSYSWPAGSGASTSVACVSASAIRVGGLQNWLANSDFETWSGTPAAPSSWSIGVGAAGTQITRATTAGTYYSGTSALALAGDGSTLTAISQPLGATPTTALAPLDQLAWNAWVRTSGSPASGTLEIALVDGSGNVLDDAQGHPASSSFAASSLGSSFAAIGGFLRTPRVLPAAASLRIRLSAPLPVGSTLYLDRLALARAAELYAGGPCLAAFSGATNLIKGDAYSVATTNDRHGLFQSGFDMMANLKGLGLLLPSTSGTPTIPNSWVA